MNDLKGLGVSPGIARGEALVLRQRARGVTRLRQTLQFLFDRAGGDEVVAMSRALAQNERLATRDPGRDAQALQVVHVSLITSTPPLR